MTRRLPFDAAWQIQRTAPGEAPIDTAWRAIPGPSTAAAALRALGEWSIDGPALDWDASDWWFQACFETPPARGGAVRRQLEFGGLAGVCEAWLDGEPVFSIDNMHLSQRVADPGPGAHELTLRFGSLQAWLSGRRARPRWRTPMVANQNLRWARVSLLGRTPGWTPPVAAVGPWRPVEWIESSGLAIGSRRLHAHLRGEDGVVEAVIGLESLDLRHFPRRVRLRVERDGEQHETVLNAVGGQHIGTLQCSRPELWWPHTHGEPALYEASLLVDTEDRETLERAQGEFSLSVNGVPVFARGACWMPLDPVSLRHDPAACRAALRQACEAGMNMLRIPGNTVYADEDFHAACDELGLMVWQDFMFSNMDYPTEDPSFAASIREEARQQLERWHAHPSLTVLCGNSEVAQQAAMWGAPREAWRSAFFEHELGELASLGCPGVPWWPSSAWGGEPPQRADVGTTAYYGLGAYLRPVEDARRSGLRFATECLAFAHLPSSANLLRAGLKPKHPEWKARVPRDQGVAWDFEDVRDHYLQVLYRVDPFALRREDPERYLALGRATGAELLQAAFTEWRRPASTCRGALVWFLRDLWAGCGFGLLDDQGLPKAAFRGMARAIAPRAISISDEGGNGLDLHLFNESPKPLQGEIELSLFREDGLLLESVRKAVSLAPRESRSLAASGCHDRFIDLNAAYRFGPADHALVCASLFERGSEEPISQAFHFPRGLEARRERSVGLRASVRGREDGAFEVELETDRFAQALHFEVPGYLPSDEYFHLAPGSRRHVLLSPLEQGRRFGGTVAALNDHSLVVLQTP